MYSPFRIDFIGNSFVGRAKRSACRVAGGLDENWRRYFASPWRIGRAPSAGESGPSMAHSRRGLRPRHPHRPDGRRRPTGVRLSARGGGGGRTLVPPDGCGVPTGVDLHSRDVLAAAGNALLDVKANDRSSQPVAQRCLLGSKLLRVREKAQISAQ